MPMHFQYKGINLWEWTQGIRKKYKKGGLTLEQINFFGEIGFEWDVFAIRWNNYYEDIKTYYNDYGNILMPVHYKTKTGKDLWNWLSKQRNKYKNKKLSESQIEKLDLLGMIWDLYEFKWMQTYLILLDYYKQYGNIDVPVDCIYKNIKLGMWLSTQRQAYRGNPNYSIKQNRIDKLNELSMDWKEENNTRK